MFKTIWAQPIWFKLAALLNAGLVIVALTIFFHIENLVIAVPAFLALFGILCFLIGPIAALSAHTFLLTLFYAASFAKLKISGFGLVLSDISLLGPNVVDLFVLDWRVQLLVLGLLLLFLFEGAFIVRVARFGRFNFLIGVLFCIPVVFTAPRALATLEEVKGSEIIHQISWAVAIDPSLTSFIASLNAPYLEARTEPRSIWAASLDLEEKPRLFGEPFERKVNFFAVLYESIFDPAYLDVENLPVLPSRILRPETGHSGPLIVPVYGGGTWLTEFSLFQGQSPLAYGANAYSLNSLMEGRLRSSHLEGLAGIGFALDVVYPVAGYFLNARSFYEGLGMRFHEPPARQLEQRRAFRDELIFERAFDLLAEDKNSFQLIVTMQNHGPHDLSDPFGDYWKHFMLQERKLEDFKAKIAARFGSRENYFLYFGDHHPVFTLDYGLPKEKRYTTFWAIDCVGLCERIDDLSLPKGELGTEFLLGLVFEQLDLPTGPVFSAHRELLARDCYSLDFHCAENDRHAFNWIFETSLFRP
ncbi:MAG: hypothetical protein R3245_02140 [Kiloniellales bacterium]|nr:hypothetical protein [Kiloniellales bacterium]